METLIVLTLGYFVGRRKEVGLIKKAKGLWNDAKEKAGF